MARWNGRARALAVAALGLCTTGADCGWGTPLNRLDPSQPDCPPRYSACGSGCIPSDHSCCPGGDSQCGSDGSGNGTGRPCTLNTGGTCSYAGGGIPSKYCCGEGERVVGSLDVPTDRTYDGSPGVFCGLTAIRPGDRCCNDVGECGQTGVGGRGSSGSGGGSSGGGITCGSRTCTGREICISTRNCIPSSLGGSCSCAGSTSGSCYDMTSRGVTQCGSCSSTYSACCPGSMCVNGRCKSSCP